jgi:glutamate racemase
MGNCIFISANLIIKIHAGQASEVHEAEIREIILLGCTDFPIYSQNIDDIVHTLTEYTLCIVAPEVKVQGNRDENGKMHFQIKLILQSNEIIL